MSYRCRCDDQWTMEFISDEVKILTGYPASDFLQNAVRSWASIMHPEDKEASEEHAMEQINRKEPYTLEYRIIGADGSIRWCYEKGQGVFDEQGKLRFLDGVIVDRTEHKQTEEVLCFKENIIKSSSSAIATCDFEGIMTYGNPSFRKLWGYDDPEEFLGKHFLDLWLVGDEYEEVMKVLRVEGTWTGELKAIRKDGTLFDVHVTAALVFDVNENPISLTSTSIDITDKKKMKTQLQQVTKMEAIATLAGGVAHEFNNSLMGIMGHIELLKMNLPEDERRNKSLDTMNRAGHRMSRLTDQLLAYAQGGKYQPKDLKMDDFVIETLPILQHELSLAVRVATHFQKDISFVNADNAQMQMVLSAILTNSNEAIEDKGTIRITAENKDLDVDFTKQYPGLKPGHYVCLTVEDDGRGMDEETRDGIFEPFFTTKFQGRGMGMAAVHGIVRNHDGWISVDSKLGKGTTVQIYLPAIEIEVEKPKKTKAEATTGTGTILMIEDEDVVTEVTQEMLEMLGYRVQPFQGSTSCSITCWFN